MTRLRVGVLGATGVAGLQALVALADHPWFELARATGSPRRAGRTLGDVHGARAPARFADLVVEDGDRFEPRDLDLVFSMLPTDAAARLEPRCAETLPVLSTAAAFRAEPDTPLLLAGVNPDHARRLGEQRRARGWRGFVAPGPNCTAVGLAVTLAPLHAAFGVRGVTLTSMQAVSGAGGGAAEVARAVEDNLLPYIAGEEEKVEAETRKILGADFPVAATCTRVAVSDGHTESVSVALGEDATPEAAGEVLAAADPWAGRDLPSAPARWIEVRAEPDRPQPRLDRDAGGGLTTVVGRLRPDPVSGGVRYVLVSHNTRLGAAMGAVLLAEDLLDRGLLRAR